MNKQTIEFPVKQAEGIVTGIGRSHITHPEICFKGIGIKWYEDKPKQQHNNNHG